tara:strand:- start:839 stop:1507 length:669 start_codon:yes stop_codon:yes gene_type:complete
MIANQIVQKIKKPLVLFILYFFCSNTLANSFTMDVTGSIFNMSAYNMSYNGDDLGSFAMSFEGTNVETGETTHLYCIEILQSLDMGEVEFTQVDLSSVDDKYHKAAWLMDTFSYYTDTFQSGVLQLAIWEAVHETEDLFDLYTGVFQVVPTDEGHVNFAVELSDITNSFILNYDPNANLDHMAIYVSTTVQDVIGNEILDVPEPPVLMFFLLSGLYLINKKR